MAHYGMLGEYRLSADVDDIRGASLYGLNDDKLGKIEDVIFDHATGRIEYVVVETGGWLSNKKFLVPADRIHPSAQDEKDFAIDATKEQIESLPKYDKDAMKADADWSSYDRSYREAWGSGPVLHKEGSTHTITPEASQMPAGTGSGANDEAYTPDRLAGKFPQASADPSKIRMRPTSAAKAEDSRLPGEFEPADIPTRMSEEAERADSSPDPVLAQRDHLTDPDEIYVSEQARAARLSAFEEHLRRNRSEIVASCGTCGIARDKVA
jgi:hypothetical protein